MKKILFTLVLIVAATGLGSLKAQVTIGSNVEPDANALLDLKETATGTATKGLLLPRVALTSTASFSPMSAHVPGMTVYNTANVSDVTAGYYYNDGTKWVRLADAANIPSAWLLGGNTNGALRYIGTKDAFDFPVKVNNYEAMRVIWDADNSVPRVVIGATAAVRVASTTSNSSVPLQWSKLTVDNGDASINGITIGLGGGQIATNTALGAQSLYNNKAGTYNVGVGSTSLNANTSGDYNVGVGYQALKSNQTGNNNVAIGENALFFNTASNNTAVGHQAGDNITTGTANVGVGSASLDANSTGDYNVGIGYQALKNNATGNNNVAIGENALFYNTAGNNTAIGFQAGDNIESGANNIAIGALTDIATPTANNQLNIGNAIFGTGMSGTVSAPAGNIGIGTSAPTQKLDVNGNLRVRTIAESSNTSDVTLVADANGVVKSKLSDIRGIFRAYLSANFSTGTTDDNSVHKITGFTTIDDPGNNFDQGVFTAPTTGLYQVTMTVTLTAIATNNQPNYVVGVAKSSTDNWVMRFSIPASYIEAVGLNNNAGTASTFVGVVQLTAGQTYYFGATYGIKILANPTGSSGTGIGTYFEIKMIKNS